LPLVLLFFPMFGGIYYIVNQERSVSFFNFHHAMGIVSRHCSMVVIWQTRNIISFNWHLVFFRWGVSFGFGGWLVFTTILSRALRNIVSTPITYTISALIFLSYSTVLFMRYYIDFKKNEHKYLKGIDFSTGIIDPLKTKLFNAKLDQKEIEHSPFFLPVKLFLFIGIPLGGIGCVLLLSHLGESIKFILFALTTYSSSIIGIVSGMAGYFSLFTLARLQIKHKKWFQLATLEEETKQKKK
jgi:hypothetical protein